MDLLSKPIPAQEIFQIFLESQTLTSSSFEAPQDTKITNQILLDKEGGNISKIRHVRSKYPY